MTSRSRATLWQTISWVLLVLGIIYFVFRGPIFPNGQRLWDYAVCASSSYLWVHGEDPFEWNAVKESWLTRGGAPGITRDIGWLYAIVPPTTLATLSPFAAMPVALGAYLYLLVTTALTGIAVWLCGQWANLRGGIAWRLYLAMVLVSVPATLGLYSGNPTMLATPLLLIGSYWIAVASTTQREWLGGALIGIAVACKIQMGVPILLFWIFMGRWRVGLSAVVVAGAIAGIAIARLSFADVEWLTSWVENVRKMTTEGGLNDYVTAKNPDDLLNLQVALYRLLGSRPLTDGITLAVCAVLGVGLLAAITRARGRPDPGLPLLGVASVLLLLPVYHRTYDAIILMPMLAGVIAGLSRDKRWATGWLSLVLLGALAVPAGLPNYLVKRGAMEALQGPSLLASLVIGHKAWCLLGLGFVWCSFCWTRPQTLTVVQEK